MIVDDNRVSFEAKSTDMKHLQIINHMGRTFLTSVVNIFSSDVRCFDKRSSIAPFSALYFSSRVFSVSTNAYLFFVPSLVTFNLDDIESGLNKFHRCLFLDQVGSCGTSFGYLFVTCKIPSKDPGALWSSREDNQDD